MAESGRQETGRSEASKGNNLPSHHEGTCSATNDTLIGEVQSGAHPVRRTMSSRRSKNADIASSGSRVSETIGDTPRLSRTSS